MATSPVAMELMALAAHVKELEAQRKSQADEAQRIINSQRITIDRFKLENRQMQEDLAADTKASNTVYRTHTSSSTLDCAVAPPPGCTHLHFQHHPQLVLFMHVQHVQYTPPPLPCYAECSGRTEAPCAGKHHAMHASHCMHACMHIGHRQCTHACGKHRRGHACCRPSSRAHLRKSSSGCRSCTTWSTRTSARCGATGGGGMGGHSHHASGWPPSCMCGLCSSCSCVPRSSAGPWRVLGVPPAANTTTWWVGGWRWCAAAQQPCVNEAG